MSNWSLKGSSDGAANALKYQSLEPLFRIRIESWNKVAIISGRDCKSSWISEVGPGRVSESSVSESTGDRGESALFSLSPEAIAIAGCPVIKDRRKVENGNQLHTILQDLIQVLQN